MKLGQILKGLKRFLTPSIVVSLVYFLRYKAKISPKAEVDLTPNLTFGKNCVVSSFSKFKAMDGPITIGDRGGFATGCFIATGEAGITIGENAIVGPNVNIVSVNYRTDQLDVHLEDLGQTSKGIKIGKNVWIGAGCTILDGAVIGDNTIVVANSLVNRRYKPNVILQGNPAKVLMKR
ncbi:MAG: DapH/DapD/GlmU-related protein [Anaerolineae bacterium]